MKKTLFSLFASVLISMTLVSGSTYASDDATSTLTVTETQSTPQTQEAVLPQTPTEQQVNTPSNEQNTNEQNTEAQQPDENTITTDETQIDSEAIEISDSEAQLLSADPSSEFDVFMFNGKHHKKKKNHPCTTGTTPIAPIAGSIDLWIRKGASVNAVTTGNVGDTVSYIITYGNAGNMDATGVTITESFPVGFVSTGALAGWVNTPGTTLYTYTLGTLTPGQTGQINLVGTLLIGTTGGVDVPNIVQITSSTYEDPIVLANNIASAIVTSFGPNGCGCGLTGSTGSFQGRVYFDNDNNALKAPGEIYAAGVTVLLKSLTGVVLQTLTTDGSGNYSGVALSGFYTLEVVPLPGYSVTTMNNEMVTILAGANIDLGEDGLFQPVPVGPTAINLWLKKTAVVNGTNTGNVGDVVTYTLTYGNSGNALATGVSILDSFPVGFVSTGAFAGWTNATGTTLFSFFVGSLAAGQTGQIVFTGTLLIGTPGGVYIPNIAQISSTTLEDPTLLNDNISFAAVTSFGSGGCGCGPTGSTGSFQGRVYFDNDNNATRAANEPYASGVTVLIKSLTGVVLLTLTTDGSGNYNGVIGSGTYIVQVLPLPGYVVTTINNEQLLILGNTNTDLGEDGLYQPAGGGGGGGFGGGFVIPVTPTTPTNPTTPTDPRVIDPIGPNPETPLPTELLDSGPDISFSELVEQLPVVQNTAIAMQHTAAFIQSIPSVVQKITMKPLTYINVLQGYESTLSSFIASVAQMILISMLLAVGVYLVQPRKNYID